jgi:Fe-S cluster assembly protein SufD
MSTLPTRKAEDWRYADLAALEKLWPCPRRKRSPWRRAREFARAIVNKGGVVQLSLVLEAGAQAAVHVLNTANAYARIEIEVTLHEGADFKLGGVQLSSGDQTAEIVTTVRHIEPNATSHQMIRSVAGGTSTASVLGKVYVAKGAMAPMANNRCAMLLDRTAQANARPELEIYADDVKCAHGCAIGELTPTGCSIWPRAGSNRPAPGADAAGLYRRSL